MGAASSMPRYNISVERPLRRKEVGAMIVHVGHRFACSLAMFLFINSFSPVVQAGDLTLAMSLGQEVQFKPPPVGQARATSLMISPGYQLNKMFRVELGINYMIDAMRRGKTDLQIRPNMTAEFFPGWYARVHLGIAHLLDEDAGEQRLSVGGSVGRTVNMGGVPFFGEVGLTPRTEMTMSERTNPDGLQKYRLFWIAEVRVGATYTFSSDEE